MTRIRRLATRYLVWGSALAFCGVLLGLKTARASPIDVLFVFFTGAWIGLVVAACIDIASGIIQHTLSHRIEHISNKFKILATIALSIIAACVWVRVVQILLTASMNEAP